ncbi:hypothetical protein [Bradyrhizobium sp. LTSPM299]|uniref:hypothetical protein n=1 Tax=Bradyrhizobium sp. LTSPM299 TaxID=1619233 RepID=UPI001FDA16F9|nr:hypothetical protein [Bradyrhizobium sp. LTSPM299]
MAKPVVHILETVEIETKQSAIDAAPGLVNRFVEPRVEQQAVGKLGEAVMLSEILDLRLGAAAFGDILVGANPSTILQGLVRDCDQPFAAEFLQESSLLPLIDEGLAERIDVVHRAARVVADRAAIGEHVVEADADRQLRHLLIVNLAELLIDELQPVLGVVQADALRHRGDGAFETMAERSRTGEAPR